MNAARALAQLDVVATLARHAVEHQWVRPTLTTKPGIDILKGRHPVVETAIESYVPSDCRLGDGRRCLIITGPNMGGKSTYMRAVALITLLAWAGSFVPAESVTIGPVDRIHTRIGASDDLARGRSTFMVEMTEAAAILHQATDRSLVLMDEIGRGTATFDGLSLAGASNFQNGTFFSAQIGTGVTGSSLWLHSKEGSGLKTRGWLKSAEPVGRS